MNEFDNFNINLEEIKLNDEVENINEKSNDNLEELIKQIEDLKENSEKDSEVLNLKIHIVNYMKKLNFS